MNDAQDHLLARELGRIHIGGSGAAFAARFLPTETFHEVIELAAPVPEATELVSRLLAEIGRPSDEPSTESTTITAVVGTGFLRLNPAIVEVRVAPASEQTSTVSITAAAKEGLIKQHSAEKAVRRIAHGLQRSI